ncbi:Flp pilus assembly complex ATPase component TadA [Candidatus Parcubacteria bacterium]|nr:Flp pilus assembly complex ATPase component TadA [Candidatus Parcubacteria bacterium]
MIAEEKKLKEFIADSGLVSKADIRAAEMRASKEGTTLGRALVGQGRIKPDDLRKIEAHAFGVPFVNLRDRDIRFDALSLIPEPISRNHNVVAYKKTGDAVEIAMLDSADLRAVDFLTKKAGLRVLPRFTDADSIKSALVAYQRNLKAEFGDVIRREIGAVGEEVSTARVTDAIVRHAMSQGASDVHIDPLEKEALVRYRIGGILHDAMTIPKHAAKAVSTRLKVLSGKEGRFKIEMNGEKISARASFSTTVEGEKAVLRLARHSHAGAPGPALEDIGFHGAGLDRVHDALRRAQGAALIAGPAASGRSTALYALLDVLNTPSVNISTVEDPVLRHIPRVNQTETRPDIGLTMPEALRSVLRQDPDVVAVGELRDGETASLALNAALVGRLALATIDAPSAAGTITRLKDLKVEPALAASALSVIIGQRLVRRLVSPNSPKPLAKAELAALGKAVDLDRVLSILRNEKIVGPKDGWDKVLFSSPKSASYEGRVGIHEVLSVSPLMRDLILKGASVSDIEAQAKKEGMATILEDGICAAACSETTIEEVLAAVAE